MTLWLLDWRDGRKKKLILLRALEKTFLTSRRTLQFGSSISVAMVPPESRNPDSNSCTTNKKVCTHWQWEKQEAAKETMRFKERNEVQMGNARIERVSARLWNKVVVECPTIEEKQQPRKIKRRECPLRESSWGDIRRRMKKPKSKVEESWIGLMKVARIEGGKREKNNGTNKQNNTGRRKISFEAIGRILMRDFLSTRSLEITFEVGRDQGFEVLRVRWRRRIVKWETWDLRVDGGFPSRVCGDESRTIEGKSW